MAQAQVISPQDALRELQQDTNALLIDVRDESEVRVTGIGIGAINAPGRSLAWKADQEFDKRYCEQELADRKRLLITTCGCSPCYRGASAANLLTEMGFDNVSSFVRQTIHTTRRSSGCSPLHIRPCQSDETPWKSDSNKKADKNPESARKITSREGYSQLYTRENLRQRFGR